MFFKRSKVKSPAYLRWVATLPCVVNKVWDPTVVSHHTRDKFKGMGTKASDSNVVPMSHVNHMALHLVGSDEKYFDMYDIDYKAIREELYRIYTQNAIDRDDKARNLILTRKVDND